MNTKGRPLFFFDQEIHGKVVLSEEESRHCSVSLRLKEGEFVRLTNGKGLVCDAVCTKAHPKAAEFKITASITEKLPPVYRRICVAPPKSGDRLDWMIEKVIEIGVNEIVLFETRNSERNKINLDRLSKIAVSVIKQSRQAYLPEILGVLKFKSLMDKNMIGQKFIAHVTDTDTVKSLKEVLEPGTPELTMLIGPEGDFSTDEVELATNMGFRNVNLGKNVLRTETAAVYAATIFNAFV